ncbi:MAG: response regulator [Spirochaetes bacterium]|nr:response regulator [Spirochaetota bacterium]
MNKYIAVVDDEKDIADLVCHQLKKNNYKTNNFLNGRDFLDSLNRNLPDLVVLDIMLPGIDGIEICKLLKNNPEYMNIKVIMLTAKQDVIDKVIGLEIGADDYVTKPFSPRELAARVKAVLRRWNENEDEIQNKIDNINEEIFIDHNKHEVYDKNGGKIVLTSTEFKILTILLKKRGWVFSREKLLDQLWGKDKYVIDRTIDVHIKNLREKLGETGKLILNIRGIGYKLEN